MEDPWTLLYQDELAEYEKDLSWGQNGIRPYVDAHGRLIEAQHPWTCGFCNQIKKFGSLEQAESHLSTKGHCNQIFWRYAYERPALPKWQRCREAAHVRAPVIGGTPSPPDPPGGLPPASVPQGLPSTAPAGGGSYTVILRNATFNGVRIASAVLTVALPNGTERPPFENPEIVGARIYGDFPLDRSSTSRSPSPPLLPSRMGAGEPAVRLCAPSPVEDSSSSCRPVAQSELAPATLGPPAQASSWRPTDGYLLPGMHRVFAKAPPLWCTQRAVAEPWTAVAKPPPPMPPAGVSTPAPRGAPADPWWLSAASVRAAA